MKKIDVTKCEYYDDYYKTCSNFSRFSDDEPYCAPINFKCSYYIENIEKQLQQLKTENEELKDSVTSARIELDKQKSLLKKHIAKLEQECEKWKSYYELYRIETDTVKKVQAVINGNPKYGIEFTENGIINKDERLSYLEIHEQIKLIIDEQAKEFDQLKAENEELRKQLMQKDEVNTFFNTLDWNDDPCKICPQKNCLDEIEEILVVDICTKCPYGEDVVKKCKRNVEPCVLRLKGNILQLIKQAKEGEENGMR